MASTIQVRVDHDLKTKSDALFKDLGTDTTTVIHMFLTQALAVNGFPFEIKRAKANPYETLTEHELLDKLEKSRKHAAQGMYKDAEEDPEQFVKYLIIEKGNMQAAENVGNDYDATIKSLNQVLSD